MRTTIRIEPHLLAEVKKIAVSTDRSLTAVIEDALRELVARRRRQSAKPKIRLTTVAGRGVRRGVDLDDTSALLDVMDGDRGPA